MRSFTYQYKGKAVKSSAKFFIENAYNRYKVLLEDSYIVISPSRSGQNGELKWVQINKPGETLQPYDLIQAIGQGLIDAQIIVGLGFMDSIVEMVEQAKRDFEEIVKANVTSEYHYLNYMAEADKLLKNEEVASDYERCLRTILAIFYCYYKLQTIKSDAVAEPYQSIITRIENSLLDMKKSNPTISVEDFYLNWTAALSERLKKEGIDLETGLQIQMSMFYCYLRLQEIPVR